MPSIGYLYGHLVYFDENADVFRYVDTGETASVPPTRPCPKCHRHFDLCSLCADNPGGFPTPFYDPCLGHIPGQVVGACCGHGRFLYPRVYFKRDTHILLRFWWRTRWYAGYYAKRWMTRNTSTPC